MRVEHIIHLTNHIDLQELQEQINHSSSIQGAWSVDRALERYPVISKLSRTRSYMSL